MTNVAAMFFPSFISLASYETVFISGVNSRLLSFAALLCLDLVELNNSFLSNEVRLLGEDMFVTYLS